MRYYQYVIEKTEDDYIYYEKIHDTTPETEQFFSEFQYDKVNILDVPDSNKQVFLFDNPLMLEAFKCGVYAEHNLKQRFEQYEHNSIHARESKG